MKYDITEYDKELLLQNNIRYKTKIEVTNLDREILDVLTGIIEFGGGNIDADSNIRRTQSFILQLDDYVNDIEDKLFSWIGLYYDVYVGVMDNLTEEYKYYPNGRYLITDASTKYDAVTNTISFNLSDRISELDGTRNGQIGGAPTILIPNKDEETGEFVSIRTAVVNQITSNTNIDKYIIDDVGEFYGMSQNNPDYEAYRANNDLWNKLPYDLKYSVGCYQTDILFEIRDLYPNCQMYFDVYDNFCFDMIPSLDNDLPALDNDYLQKIILSNDTESVQYDISSIKNVTEVFGKSFDPDRYAETSTYADNVYTITLEEFEGYKKYEQIAFEASATNTIGSKFQVNGLEKIPIYYEYTDTPINDGEFIQGEVYVLKIYKIEDKYIAYYLGQFQPHALCVLTADVNDPKYTKGYFSQKYNVKENNIVFREQKFSPFTVQKLGEILDVKEGDIFDNISSNTVAKDTSMYYNRLSSTMFDTVTITTIKIPWLDVNLKVNYKKQQEDETYSYVIKKVSHSAESTSITMYRFLQLYEK